MPQDDPVFLARVLDALSGFVYVYDLQQARNVYVSCGWAEGFGYDAQETKADDLMARIIHPADLQRVAAHHARLAGAESDDPRAIEYRVLRRDGSTVWLSSSDRPFRRDEQGRVTQIVGQAHDISAQKRAESRKDEADARFRAVVRHLPDAVFMADAQSRILNVNDAACTQLGYTREELCSMRLPDMIAPEFRSRVPERLSAPMGSATTRLSAHLRKDGTRVPVETTVLAIELDGAPVYLGVARDISQRQALEAQLRDAQRMEAIGRLAGAVAHDFNNTLAAILGGASLLEESNNMGAEERSITSDIVTAATRGAELTRQLLTFSRRAQPKLEPLDLAQRVETTLGVLRRLLDPAIQVETDLQPGCTVMADASMMDQVVMNLTLNARDAMPHGGQLRLSVTAKPGDANLAQFIVSDSGKGIATEDLSRVFEPFFTTKSGGNGSGIGLATVYGIVTQHGGSISVDSSPGTGTRFQIELPRAAPGLHQAQPAATPSSHVRPLRVLVVDDMAPVRAMMTRILTFSGHTVTEASSAPEAIAAWEAQGGAFDLLLSDIALGSGGNGRQLAATLRERAPELVIVLMSGFAPDQAQPAAGRSYDFLQKPFRMEDLNSLIARRFKR